MKLANHINGKLYALRTLFRMVVWLANWRAVWSAYRISRPIPPLHFRRGLILLSGPSDDPVVLLREVFADGCYRRYATTLFSGVMVDIGANIGQMTSLLRARAGKSGKVISFEPHPELFAELSASVDRSRKPAIARVELYQAALSDRVGDAELEIPQHWPANRGVAKLSDGMPANGSRRLKVQLTTLDKALHASEQVGVCKIDVEGHEINVFKGASGMLRERRIRDIIFEDFQRYPSPLQTFLADAGFRLFSLHTRLLKPLLSDIPPAGPQFAVRDGANYLATLDPARAVQRFKTAGWRVFKSRSSFCV